MKLSGPREKIVESRNKLLLETENSVYEIDLRTNLQQNLKIKYACNKTVSASGKAENHKFIFWVEFATATTRLLVHLLHLISNYMAIEQQQPLSFVAYGNR